MTFEKVDRSQSQFSLFIEINGFGRVAMLAGFDLDEDDDLPITADQVDFPLSGPITPDQHFHPALMEEPSRRPLAAVTQPSVPERPDNGRFRSRFSRHRLASHTQRPLDLRPFGAHGTRQSRRFEQTLDSARPLAGGRLRTVADRRTTPDRWVIWRLRPDGLLAIGTTPRQAQTSQDRQKCTGSNSSVHASPAYGEDHP